MYIYVTSFTFIWNVYMMMYIHATWNNLIRVIWTSIDLKFLLFLCVETLLFHNFKIYNGFWNIVLFRGHRRWKCLLLFKWILVPISELVPVPCHSYPQASSDQCPIHYFYDISVVSVTVWIRSPGVWLFLSCIFHLL